MSVIDRHRPGARATAALTLVAALSAFAPSPAAAQELATVTVGVANTSSDAPFFIGEKRGFFREEGITVKIIPFRGAPEMMAPLGAGQLDVAGAAPSAGLYNGIASGLDMRIVADKGSVAPGYGYGPLMIRKELVTRGRYKTVKDLKGVRFAEASPGTMNAASVARLLQTAGLTYADVQHVYIGFPQQAAAFANGALDAAVTAEPAATIAEREGVAVRIAGNDTWYNRQEQSVVTYSGPFMRKRDLAVRFMTGYIRSLRFYNDALAGGHLRGPNADAVINILISETPLKDRRIYQDMVPNAVDPEGRLILLSLGDDLAFLKAQGYVTGEITVLKSIDSSFQEEALRRLGRYHPKKK